VPRERHAIAPVEIGAASSFVALEACRQLARESRLSSISRKK
jgi:hypothetical protein